MKETININEILIKNIEQALKPIRDTQMAIQKSLEPLKEVHSAIQGVGETALRVKSAFNGIFNEEFYDKMRKFAKELEQLPDNMKLVMLKLADEGWFYGISADIGLIKEMKSFLNNGNIEVVENFLIQYFDEQLDDIEEMVVKRSPKRELIIREAFDAHREGKYNLSIPVLLSQAEGICYEITKTSCFRKEERIPQTAQYVKEKGLDNDEIESVMTILLTQTLPINQNVNSNADNFNGVNRHIILHGKSTNYGTEKNSLKAISFLNYIVELFNIIEY